MTGFGWFWQPTRGVEACPIWSRTEAQIPLLILQAASDFPGDGCPKRCEIILGRVGRFWRAETSLPTAVRVGGTGRCRSDRAAGVHGSGGGRTEAEQTWQTWTWQVKLLSGTFSGG